MQEGFGTMTRTKLTRTFLAACSAVALSAAVYGCGGGGGDGAEPKPPAAVDFSGVAAGYTVEAGTYRIAAGATLTVGDVTFSCASGGAGCTLMVLADGTATYAASGGKVTAASSPLHGQRTTANAAVEAAASLIGGLSAASSAAVVAAAQDALDAAKAALAAVTALPASEFRVLQARIEAAGRSLEAVKATIADNRTRRMQRTAATEAVGAAELAVGALTAGSTDAEVAAAEQAVAAAKAAVAAGTLLTPAESEALSGAIALAETSLGAVKAAIVGGRTHAAQLGAVEAAVAAAQAAVDALDRTSTDAAIDAAQALIDAAARALSDGTVLTDDERSAAAEEIAGFMTSLERVTVEARIHAANSAIEGLTADSTDAEADVAAAQNALDAAKAALASLTALPASEFHALQDRIDAAGRRLEAVKAAIADNRTRRMQLAAATEAVGAAELAVGALTAGSTDAEVAAAEQAVAAAKAAVAAGTLLTPAESEALSGAIALAETSLGAVKAAIVGGRTHAAQLGAVEAAVAAAQAAVDALDRTSTDAAIDAAQALIDAAARALSDGTVLTDDERSAAAEEIAGFMTSLERVTVEARIHAANSAIEGLTASSTDAEVDAAQAAISAATAALRKVQLLTGPQVIAFQGDIDAARSALAAKRTEIADSKTHRQQLTVLDSAVTAARDAVDALDRTSSDAALDAAQAGIEAAEAAVAAGTKLTADEKAAANATILASRTALERVTVEAKVHAARTAVGGLSAASSDADVAAAQSALDAAAEALGNVRLLTASEALAFRDSIDAAGAALETAKTQIADARTHGRQLDAVTVAVGAASRAVSGLSADSTGADAEDAAAKIQAAKDAVAAGTALTASERASASETIAAAERTLVTRRAAITARREDAKAMAAALTAAPGTAFDANLSAIPALVDGGTVTIAGYERSTTDTAPAVAGWAGSVYEDVSRDADGRTVIERDTVVVYTDKAAPRSARYTTYYARGANEAPATGASAGYSWRPWVVVDSVSDDTNGILGLTEGVAIEAADVGRLFGAGNFGAGQEKLPQEGDNRTYADEDGATPGTQVELSGSFHGVAGRFTCDGTTCTAEMTNAGALTLAGNGAVWSFVPGTTNVSVGGAQEDADYLDFGYWSKWDADGGSGGSQAYTVEAFFRGADPYDAVDRVEGSARYRGKAVGLYARQVYDGNTLLDDRAGRFTADVALTAYFGGGAVAADDRNSIGGTVSDFMDGGRAIDSGWSVRLNRIGGGSGGSGTFDAAAGTFTEGATAGGGTAGTWSGAFYGDDTAEGNDVPPQPGSVAGEFTAGFHNGSAVGAFGARKQ